MSAVNVADDTHHGSESDSASDINSDTDMDLDDGANYEDESCTWRLGPETPIRADTRAMEFTNTECLGYRDPRSVMGWAPVPSAGLIEFLGKAAVGVGGSLQWVSDSAGTESLTSSATDFALSGPAARTGWTEDKMASNTYCPGGTKPELAVQRFNSPHEALSESVEILTGETEPVQAHLLPHYSNFSRDGVRFKTRKLELSRPLGM